MDSSTIAVMINTKQGTALFADCFFFLPVAALIFAMYARYLDDKTTNPGFIMRGIYMTRRAWLVAVPTALSCGRSAKVSGFSFPAAFGPDWKLSSVEDVPESSVPEEVRRLGLRAATRGKYQSKAELKVTVYQMTSEGGAFEMRQKHRPDEGFLAFHRGDLFIVMESAGMDNHELVAAAEAFEDALGKVQR